MPIGTRLAGLLTIAAASLNAANVSGIVLDPAGLRVAGARVVLACTGRQEAVVTAWSGRFVFDVGPAEFPCTIQVFSPGFRQSKTTIASAVRVTLRLELAAVQERVEIEGSAESVESDRPALDSAFGSASLNRSELSSLSNDTAELIRYSKLLAGAAQAPETVWVNGVPAQSLPPAGLIERITINDEPLSVESAHGDETRIDILTRRAVREWRVQLPAFASNAGSRNPLNPDFRSRATSLNGGLSGFLPKLPVVFSMNSRFSSTTVESPVFSVRPTGDPDSVESSSQIALLSAYADADPTEHLRAHLSYVETRANSTNSGVDGVTLPEAGISSRLQSREASPSVTTFFPRFVLRAAGSLTHGASIGVANSDRLGIVIPGALVSGGATMARAAAGRSRSYGSMILSSITSSPWLIGVSAAQTRHSVRHTPNPEGVLHFESTREYESALAGAPSGTLLRTLGNGSLDFATATLSPFAQARLYKSGKITLSAGIRGEYQQYMGWGASPRISAALSVRRFIIRFGGATFVQNVPDDVFIRAQLNGPEFLERYLVRNAGLTPAEDAMTERATRIEMRLSDGLRRTRDDHFRLSVERHFGAFVPGIEYSHTRGHNLGGLRRIRTDTVNWIDLIESNRSSERRRLHAQVRMRKKSHVFAVHYEWLDSRDNTDGFLSHPADPFNLAGEWARSTGVSPHSANAFAMMRLPHGATLTLSNEFRSPAPYNITTGLDPGGSGLFVDRGGRPRNSGQGSIYNSLMLGASRRFQLPFRGSRQKERRHVTLRLHGENLLGGRNFASFGSVEGGAAFGRPLTASAGRSIRFSVMFD